MAAITPDKLSLIADLVSLINENLGALLHVKLVNCPDCRGVGTVGGETDSHGTVHDGGTLLTCSTCHGVGAIEQYQLDHSKLTVARYGRLIEGFEYKQGQYIPKFRSKDKAFGMLTKLLGFDKAVIEIANGSSFVETLSTEQRDTYVDQLKEMAAMGLLDRVGAADGA